MEQEVVDLLNRDIIRIIDLAYIGKGEDGTPYVTDTGDPAGEGPRFAQFAGTAKGLLGIDDLEEPASALEPGRTKAAIVWENCWITPAAAALRRFGGHETPSRQ